MDGQLLGVIIGGIIAIIGGAVGPMIQHHLSSKERKAESKRQSTLDIIEAIFHHNEYIEKYRKNIMFGESNDLTTNPMAKIEGLVATDFPDCQLPLAKFRYAGTVVASWSTQRGLARLKGEKITLDGWEEAIDQYTLATSNLIAAITGSRQLTSAEVKDNSRQRIEQ